MIVTLFTYSLHTVLGCKHTSCKYTNAENFTYKKKWSISHCTPTLVIWKMSKHIASQHDILSTGRKKKANLLLLVNQNHPDQFHRSAFELGQIPLCMLLANQRLHITPAGCLFYVCLLNTSWDLSLYKSDGLEKSLKGNCFLAVSQYLEAIKSYNNTHKEAAWSPLATGWMNLYTRLVHVLGLTSSGNISVSGPNNWSPLKYVGIYWAVMKLVSRGSQKMSSKWLKCTTKNLRKTFVLRSEIFEWTEIWY